MHGNVRKQGAGTLGETALDIIKDCIAKNPDAEKSEIFEKFIKRIEKNPQAYREALMYFFTNMYWSLRDGRAHHGSQGHRERAEENRLSIDSAKRQLWLMKLTLPSGKLVEEATFGELAKAGGIFTAWSKLGKPSQIVGKTVTEAQLRKAAK